MKIVKLLVLFTLMVMLAGPAWAESWNFYYDAAGGAHWKANSTHMKQAPNGKGDVLVFPFRINDASLSASFKIANTSCDQSTVAKVVVRSHRYSDEILDFLIYLSPCDVWSGKLVFDPAEESLKIYSEDDSVLADKEGTWASPDNPLNEAMRVQELELDDDVGLGYVTVIDAVASSGANGLGEYSQEIRDALAELPEGNNVNTRGVEKEYVKSWYDSLNADLELQQGKDRNGFTIERYDGKAYDNNILSGWMEFYLQGFFTGQVQATTFRDHRVVNKLTTGQESFLGNFAYDGEDFGQSLTELYQVETALAKDEVVMPYKNTPTDFTLHLFNFPSKYSQVVADENLEDLYAVESPSPYFQKHAIGSSRTLTLEGVETVVEELCLPFTPTVLDEMENTEPVDIFSPREPLPGFCTELEWIISSGFPYEKGVVHYEFGDYTEVDHTEFPVGEMSWVSAGPDYKLVWDMLPYEYTSFTGTPVIPVTLDIGLNLNFTDGIAGLSIADASWDDGEVSVTEDEIEYDIPFYQYADDQEIYISPM